MFQILHTTKSPICCLSDFKFNWTVPYLFAESGYPTPGNKKKMKGL